MKMLHFIKNKIFLKYSLIILTVFLVGAIVLYQSHKTQSETVKQIKKDNSAEIKKYIKEADLLFDKSSYNSAYLLYKKAILLCDPIDDYADDYVYSELSIANLFQNTGDFTACEESILKVFPHLKKTTRPKFTYNTYTILAYNYYFTYDYNNALLYHKKALKLAVTPFKKSVIINDIALIYSTQNKHKEVIDILEPLAARKIKHESDSTKTDNDYSLILNNLGYSYYKVKNPKALDCFKKSLEIQLRLKQDYELMSTYGNLAMVYSKTDPKLSKMYTEKQYEVSCIAKSASFKANTLAQLIQKSEGKELKQYSQAYIKIIDSILSSRNQAKTQFSVIKYESKTDKEENLKLKAEKAENELLLQRHKNRNLVSYILITFILGVLFFLSLYLSIKGKRERKQAVYESERRISDKLHNELTQEAYDTLTFAQHKDLENIENKNELLTNLEKLYSHTRNISRENSFIITNEFYQIGLKEMISEFKTPDVNILLNGLDAIDWNKINKNKKITLYRVLQELFLNMKKHSNATLVSTIFKVNENNLTVIYTDNGIGISDNELIFKNGLQNVENRIKTINGTITFDNNPVKGFKLSFSFPL